MKGAAASLPHLNAQGAFVLGGIWVDGLHPGE